MLPGWDGRLRNAERHYFLSPAPISSLMQRRFNHRPYSAGFCPQRCEVPMEAQI